MVFNFLKFKKFIPVILLIVSFLIFYYSAWPTYQQVKNIKNLIQEKKQAVNILEKLQDMQELEKIDKILPNNPEIPELMVQLEYLSNMNSAILKTINFQKSETNTIKIQTQLAGTYLALKNYLKSVESNLRLINIKSLSFQDSLESQMYNFNLIFESYYGN